MEKNKALLLCGGYGLLLLIIEYFLIHTFLCTVLCFIFDLPLIFCTAQFIISKYKHNNLTVFLNNKNFNYLIIFDKKKSVIFANYTLLARLWPNIDCNNLNNLDDFLVKIEIALANYIDNFLRTDVAEDIFQSAEQQAIFSFIKKDNLYAMILNGVTQDSKNYQYIENNNHNIKNTEYQNNVDFHSCMYVDNNLDNFIFQGESNDINEKIPFLKIKNFFLHLQPSIWNSFFEHLNLPFCAINSDLKIILRNEAFLNIKDSHALSENTNIFDFLNIESIETYNKEIKKIHTNKAKSISFRVHLNNKNESLMMLYIHKIHENFFLCCFIDITEQRNLEVQFIQSQKMQAIGQLAGGIAHDFNNLLTAIIGYCDVLLTRHFPGDESFNYISHVKKNVDRASNLVKQLLALSRQQILQPKVIDPYSVIFELSFLIKRLIGEGVELKCTGEKEISYIKFDQGQLEQIIINLAINARDAMNHKGKLMINITHQQVNNENNPMNNMYYPEDFGEKIQNGEYIVIDIIDNGSGISKKNLNKIFEPFFSTKDINSGTGLGLSTVYGIIRQANGFIFVDTKENEGTKFSIFLEKYYKNNAEYNDDNHHELLKDDSINEEKVIKSNLKIVLIEDDEAVRTLIKNVLQVKGYEINEFSTGEDASDFLVNNVNIKVDIIISDIIMPGIDGPKLINQVINLYPDVKVIFISGYSKQYLKDIHIDNEKICFLQKPFSMNKLVQMIQDKS